MSEMLLETRGLTKRYGHHKAVDSVSMHIKKGAIYGFIGRNGAGKTTCLKMISGLSRPTSGEIEIFGYKGKDLQKVRSRVGCLIEAPGLYGNMTAYENLNIKCKLFGIKKAGYIDEILKTVGLEHVGRKKTKHFSLGMKQRLGIANAIMHDPELLILDEPTNGLDPIGIAEVRAFIRSLSEKEGKTILVSSHILSEISMLADDIGILDHGVLLEEETMEELKKKNQKYILLQVSDTAATARILEQQMALQVGEYSIQDTTSVKIFKTTIDREALVRELTLQGVGLSGLAEKDDTLEDYFKKITGGEGIA